MIPTTPSSEASLQLDVLAVGAHPDDVEIGCGGTVAQLVRLGYRVGLVDLTDGEPTPLCEDPAVRRAESLAAAQELGVTVRHTLDLPNRLLMDGPEARFALAKLLRRHRPRLVLGLLGMTPLASPDHWQTRLITDAAVFYSRLTKWDHRFDGHPPHTVPHLLHYRLNLESAPSIEAPHSFVMDISDTLEQKLRGIACYRTQFPPAKQHVFERVRNLAMHAGQAAGFSAGEVLFSPRPLGIRDPLTTGFLGNP